MTFKIMSPEDKSSMKLSYLTTGPAGVCWESSSRDPSPETYAMRSATEERRLLKTKKKKKG